MYPCRAVNDIFHWLNNDPVQITILGYLVGNFIFYISDMAHFHDDIITWI